MLDLNVKLFARLFRSHQQFRYVPHLDHMANRSAIRAGIVRSSYGTHLLDHLAADGTGLARGEIAVVALLEVDANLPWCTPVILKCPFTHALRYDEGGERRHAHRNVKQAPLRCVGRI